MTGVWRIRRGGLARALACLLIAAVLAGCEASGWHVTLPEGVAVPSREAPEWITPQPTSAIPPAPTPAEASERARVLEVVDGDTIRVRLDGRTVLVRYIGIDAPEVSHSGGAGEPFGNQSTALNRALVEGREVLLERDTSETDSYGRLLRYVWVDGTLVNGELVRAGLAEAKRYRPDTGRQAWLDALEREAAEARLGIWSTR
ncbi:MAG: thermonuclease family protein [Chloroflexi bacterium]|nr:thermonuclease family protein [Chloroflexota bacterium]